jgi:uncharacterized small protein (DUF1192 family)
MADELQVFGPNGQPFVTVIELADKIDEQAAEIERLRAELRRNQHPGPNGG